MSKNGGQSGGGAGKAPPGPSTTATTGGSAAGGLGAWWHNVSHGPRGEAVRNKIGSFTNSVKQQASKLKVAMPVDVKVDFLQPTIQTVRGAMHTAWNQLPPPAQQAAPYVGVAVGSGLVVYLVQQRRIQYYVGFGLVCVL